MNVIQSIEPKPDAIDYSGILRHAFDWANGLRTVGSCYYVAATIYYLSNVRYKSHIIRPEKILSDVFANINKVSVA